MKRFRSPKGIKQAYADNGVQLITVRKVEQLNAVGIHLSNPSRWQLERELETALRDMFPAVYVHDDYSWELRREHMRAVRGRREQIRVASWNDFALRTDPRGELQAIDGGAA